MAQLLVDGNYLETPFIIVKIGDYTFGKSSMTSGYKVTYPNYVQQLKITKVNGTINKYTLILDYAITEFDDPNKLDKVFSQVSSTREIKFTYGDYNNPAFIFREETATIVKVTANVDVASSKIQYTVVAQGAGVQLNAGTFYFSGRKAKGSDVILQLLQTNTFNITSIFNGMKNMDIKSQKYIATDDAPVMLQDKNCTILEYINYVVSCMTADTKVNAVLNNSIYKWAVKEDPMTGTYFEVRKMSSDITNPDTYATYDIDIGYPSGSNIVSFSIRTSDEWAILYDYSQEIEQHTYTYKIGDDGKMQTTYSPSLTSSRTYLGVTTAQDKNWWQQMTMFPISGQITIKGLLRPAMLLESIRVRVWFYGKLHSSSGFYFINKQEDSIDANGYRTTLSIQRIGEDNTTLKN